MKKMGLLVGTLKPLLNSNLNKPRQSLLHRINQLQKKLPSSNYLMSLILVRQQGPRHVLRRQKSDHRITNYSATKNESKIKRWQL
ncbi:hypothetical protein PMIT1312_00037 [Prochlorococcus marinus str. MIT 1312]|nr:hypothetical protein PMIT1312_00037 [Prochlorococcus marinus str. MIT 1312]